MKFRYDNKTDRHVIEQDSDSIALTDEQLVGIVYAAGCYMDNLPDAVFDRVNEEYERQELAHTPVQGYMN